MKIYLNFILYDSFSGIVTTHSQMRHLKVEAKRVENIERLRNVPKRSEIEKKMRDDALAKPVSTDSKGFLLLSKMGYKPGMSLGVEKEGKEEACCYSRDSRLLVVQILSFVIIHAGHKV